MRSVTDDEVAKAFGMPAFTGVTRNSVGCEWETAGIGGPSVTFSWYRGSPIGRERAGSELIGRPATDIDIQGHPGFIGSSVAKATILCELGVEFGGDFVHWSVMYAERATRGGPCTVARDLAELSVVEGQVSGGVMTGGTWRRRAACWPRPPRSG